MVQSSLANYDKDDRILSCQFMQELLNAVSSYLCGYSFVQYVPCAEDAVLGIVVDSKADVSIFEVPQCHVLVTIMNFLVLV